MRDGTSPRRTASQGVATMPRFAVRALATIMIGLAAALSSSGAALVGRPGVWTKIATTDSGFDQAGLLRTHDGKLHVVWRKLNSNGTFTYRFTTISVGGKVLGVGAALPGWVSLEGDPRLVPGGSGLRL